MDSKGLGGWQLISIKGIPLIVHPSWFIIFIFFTWASTQQLSASADSPLPIGFAWSLGFATSLLLFLSVLLHELGHSFVAIKEGVKVKSITLFFLGGMATVEKECAFPMGTLRIALAGPLVSFALSFIFFLFVDAARPISPYIGNLFTQLGSLNLLLALFNLLPGLPLDGGIILKSIVWQITGSQRKGVQIANTTGKALSIGSIFIGIYLCLKGGSFLGLWLVIIGWLGFSASRSQNQILSFQKILSDLSVGGVLGRKYRVIESNQSLQRLSQLSLAAAHDQSFPEWILVTRAGRWMGYITDLPLKEIPVQRWEEHSVSEFIMPLKELPSINEKALLWEAVIALENSKEGRLLVYNLAGLPSGTLDRIDIGEAVFKQLGVSLPQVFLKTARKTNSYPLGLALPKVVQGMLDSGIVKSD